MNGCVKQYGNRTIPKEKIENFIMDLGRVVDQAGLFATRHMRVYGEEFDLLCVSDYQKDTLTIDYSYFENEVHEKVTIDFDTGGIQSDFIGSGQFGVAVQALSMLAELYCETLCISYNCDEIVQSDKLRWLSHVLHRTLILQCYNKIWDVYERFMCDNADNARLSAMDFFNNYSGDGANFDDINTIMYINDVINDDYIKYCANIKEPTDKSSYGYWVRSMARFLWLAKQNSEKSESELLDRYMRLLHNVSNIRAQIAAGVDVSPVKELFATLAPPVTIKLIATIYNLDFWPLWRENRDSIGVTSSIFYNNSAIDNTMDDQNVFFDPITTEEFFGVNSEERLFWWREDGDVVIDSKTRKWLDDMVEQHRTHVETMDDEFSAIEWHERLVKFLGKHKDRIKMFESLYCDFLNAFHRKEFRAWIEMLEVLAESDISECRRLISVLANASLRIKIFGI